MCGSMVDIQSPAAEIRRGKKEVLEMWANAQRDGRPAQYRWRRLFNAAVRLCINDAKTRNPLKLAGCPKLTKRSQPLVGRSSPYCKDICGRYCCLTIFFRLSIRALVAKTQPDKVVRWCADGDFFASFLRPVFPASRVQHIQTCVLNSH